MVGRTPVIKIAGRGWKKISAAGALPVSPGGRGGSRRRVGQFFRLYEHDIDGPTFAEFVQGLLREVRTPITLIWDGLGVHRAPAVSSRCWPASSVLRFIVPCYVPELNSVKPMWGDSKGVKLRGVVPDDGIDLEIEAQIALQNIVLDQRLLRSFFSATPLAVPRITR